MIGRLRIIVPVLTLALVSVPLAEVVIASVAQTFSVAGVRLEADTLVVDSPRFQGRTATGSVYSMVAARAESRIGDLDTVELYDLDLDVTGEGAYTATAHLVRGAWTLSTEQLVSNEDVEVADSTGAQGFLAGVAIDWPAQIITSDGPVRFEFSPGSQLNALEMRYDIERSHWRFTDVRLEMLPTEDAGEERALEDYATGAPQPEEP